MPRQLPFPFRPRIAFRREDFVPSLASAPALAFIDSWPDWPVFAVALHGPSGSGKSHLAAIWAARAHAKIFGMADLFAKKGFPGPLVVEDVDSVPPDEKRDAFLFNLLEDAQPAAPILFTGREPPTAWKTTLPDLASRFSALLAFPLWTPDDAMLAVIARKLFDDRQLAVPDAVIEKMVSSLERSPAAIRDFVARADERALAEGRGITVALVREMLAEGNAF